MAGSQLTRRATTTWIQRSRAAAQAVRACWRASRLSSRVVRWVNRAAITGLFGSAAQTARQAATRSRGRPRPEIEVLPWKVAEALSRGHSPACLTSDRGDAKRAGAPVAATIAAAPAGDRPAIVETR